MKRKEQAEGIASPPEKKLKDIQEFMVDHHGRNLAHHFTNQGNLEELKKLKSSGFKGFNQKDNKGLTPITYALFSRQGPSCPVLEWFAQNYPESFHWNITFQNRLISTLLVLATNITEISLKAIYFIFQNVNPEARDHFYNSLPRLLERAIQVNNQNMRFFIWLINFPFAAAAQCTSPVGFSQMLSLVGGEEVYQSFFAIFLWLIEAYSLLFKLFNNSNNSISISILRYWAESDIENILCINVSNPKFNVSKVHQALLTHQGQVMMQYMMLPDLIKSSRNKLKAQASAPELCESSFSSSSDVVSTMSSSSSYSFSSSSSSSSSSFSQSSLAHSQNSNQFFHLYPKQLHPITPEEWKKHLIALRTLETGKISSSENDCTLLLDRLVEGSVIGKFQSTPSSTEKTWQDPIDSDIVKKKLGERTYYALKDVYAYYNQQDQPLSKWLMPICRPLINLTLDSKEWKESEIMDVDLTDERFRPETTELVDFEMRLRKIAKAHGGWALVGMGFSRIIWWKPGVSKKQIEERIMNTEGHWGIAYVVTEEFNNETGKKLGKSQLITYLEPQCIYPNSREKCTSHDLSKLYPFVKAGTPSEEDVFDTSFSIFVLNSAKLMATTVRTKVVVKKESDSYADPGVGSTQQYIATSKRLTMG